MDLDKYRKSEKTKYLVEEIERLNLLEQETKESVDGDADLLELAEEDIKKIQKQKEEHLEKMDEILKEAEEEDQFPNEIILEVRAGAGGEEAALFAEQIAQMYVFYAEKKG